jgi:hypothetical protein
MMLSRETTCLIDKFRDWNLGMFVNKGLGCGRKIIIL